MIDFKNMKHGCDKPLYLIGAQSTTLLYYPPIYDEEGINQNPDRNKITTQVMCTVCNR